MRNSSVKKRVGVCVVGLLWLMAPARAAEGWRVAGVVHDEQGGAVAGAEVALLDAQQVAWGSTQTDAKGGFQLERIPRGSYVLLVRARGFAEHRSAVSVQQTDVEGLAVRLALQPVHTAVTVTAQPGTVEDAELTSQRVNVIESDEISQRAKAVVAEVAEEEAGVQLQRTSPTIGGIFIRGLTGNKVNVFVDGVRYSHAGQRGGINTFLNLVEPSALETVEILRGPNSAQYGSDAMGGSVQLVSRAPVFASAGHRVRGTFSTFANTADASFGSYLNTSYATRNFGLLANLAGRRVNTLRPGQGLDSHSAFTRFLGLPSDDFLGSRMPGTAFTQYAGLLRLHWLPAAGSQVVAYYSRSQQDGGRRVDQLLGGDGNLIADLRNLMLDFFYLRFERQKLGWFDHLNLTYSFNSQREERVNQGGNGNPLASINHDRERTNVNGVQGFLAKQIGTRQSLLVGAEFYHERVRAPSFSFNPVSRTTSLRRPRVPDRSRYLSGGIYAQDIVELVPGKLRFVGNLRFSAASYRARAADSPLVGGQPLWPDDSLSVSSVTFRTGLVAFPVTGLSLSANISRGFRAPHITDLGTLGLTGSGFEVSAPDVAGLGAAVGDTAGSDAVSTGQAVEQVGPETSLSYEFGASVQRTRFRTSFAFFVNDIGDNIAKQALILPPGAVGITLGGQTITAQTPDGAVFVGASTNPVLVRVNFDDARIRGVEHTMEVQLGARWSVATIFSYVHARDRRTDVPPNIEGGTPAPDGYVKVRYAPANGRWWIEPYLHAAGRQSRLSSLDLEDRRTGALRSRSSIRNFFLNGAMARGLVGAGGDGTLGTPDDALLATGETLAQIQDRVLGVGVDSAPLFTAVPGYVTFNVRGGFRISERHSVMLDFENIGDRNYRGISWGLDAPGRSLFFRFTSRF